MLFYQLWFNWAWIPQSDQHIASLQAQERLHKRLLILLPENSNITSKYLLTKYDECVYFTYSLLSTYTHAACNQYSCEYLCKVLAEQKQKSWLQADQGTKTFLCPYSSLGTRLNIILTHLMFIAEQLVQGYRLFQLWSQEFSFCASVHDCLAGRVEWTSGWDCREGT